MKAIVLHQPYASFMRIRIKRNETRSFKIKYRGDLAICAAKVKPPFSSLSAKVKRLLWKHSMDLCGPHAPMPGNAKDVYDMLPTGKIVCIVRVKDCNVSSKISTRNLHSDERTLGNYASGRYFWETENCRPLNPMQEVTGKQGFFYLNETETMLAYARAK